MSDTPLLLTGAAGFIGYHVAQLLLRQGKAVHGVDNLNAYYDVRLKEARLSRLQAHPLFSFTKLDLAEHDAVQDVFEKLQPRGVIHLAAQAGVRHSLQFPRAYTRANIDGFLAILEGCRHSGARHLVYASSSSVYGGNTKIPFSESDGVDHPVSLYAATKRANELMAHTYSHLYNLPTTGLRFFTVYGPWGRPDMALFSFTRAILNGEPLDVYNHGRMERDFTYVDDVATAVVKLAATPATPDPAYNSAAPNPARSCAPFRLYNIGNHTPVALEEFIACIEDAVGKKALKNYLPLQPGDVPATFAKVDALAAAAGFAPSTPLATGIKAFVDWYQDYYGVA